ncbi:MAG: hypothetical protein N3A69_11140 [Leptospiraceae bacterium]|nr:hypothetical protein [Leptospiraceae bacterium]
MPQEGFNLDDFDLDISSTNFELNSSNSKSKEVKIPTNYEDEKNFVKQLLSRLEKNVERVETILTNLKYSRAFELGDESSQNKNSLENTAKELEELGEKELEELKQFLKDFTTMPRAISSYANRYTPVQKEKLRLKPTETEKYQLIFEWEMQEKLFEYLKNFGKLMIELMNLMNQKSSSGDLKVLDYRSQKMFEDAKTASLFAMGEIDQIRREVEKWKMAVSNG